MALNFQQPNFDPNEGKKRSRQEIRESLQGIPSLLFQHQALRRQKEQDDFARAMEKVKAQIQLLTAGRDTCLLYTSDAADE